VTTTGSDARAPGGRSGFLIGCGVILAFLFMGGAIFLMAIGVITPDETPTWYARVIMVLFGGGILGAGLAMLWRLAVAFAPPGEADFLGVTGAAGRGMVRRIDRNSLLAAGLLLPLVWGYWHPYEDAWWRPSADTLIALVAIEFLLIHGFPFLAFTASLTRAVEGWRKLFPGTVLALLVLLYLAFAMKFGEGWTGVLTLGYLLAPNVLGFVNAAEEGVTKYALGARWAIRFVTFFGLAMILDERTLQGAGNLRVGGAYFAVVLLQELFRVFSLPVDLADAWVRLPEERRRRALLTTT
jgi:hypothetical protein